MVMAIVACMVSCILEKLVRGGGPELLQSNVVEIRLTNQTTNKDKLNEQKRSCYFSLRMLRWQTVLK